MDKIFKDSIYNLFGFILPLFIALVFIPLLLKTLGDFKFGLLALAWTLLGYLSLLDIGFGRSITILISENWTTKNLHQVKELFKNAFSVVLLIGTFFALISLIFYPIILDIFFSNHSNNEDTVFSLILLSVSIPIITTFAVLRGFLEGIKDFKFVNTGRLFLGIGIFVVPYCITFFSKDVSNLILSILLVRLALNILFAIRISKITAPNLFKPKINKDTIIRLFQLSGWITISNFISSLMVYLDRFLIGAIISISAVTYYITPFELVTKVLLIPIAITGVLLPQFAANKVQGYSQNFKLFFNSIDTTFILFLPITILIIISSENILTIWVGKDFALQSQLILQILSVGVFFNGLAQYPFSLLQALEKPKMVTMIHLLEAIFFIPVLVFVVQSYGLVGASILWTIRSTFDFILLYIITLKLFAANSLRLPENRFYLLSALPLFIMLITFPNILFQLVISLIFLIMSLWNRRRLIAALFNQIIIFKDH